VLLVAGCREEPTIVIKFEPNDLAAKAAAPAPVVDAAAVAAPKAVEPAAADCKTAADCAVVDEECCNCASGGKQVVIAKSAAAAYKSKMSSKCKGTACVAMLSNDPSCGKVAGCVSGKCALVEPKSKK
jgi:hypothetical protein